MRLHDALYRGLRSIATAAQTQTTPPPQRTHRSTGSLHDDMEQLARDSNRLVQRTPALSGPKRPRRNTAVYLHGPAAKRASEILERRRPPNRAKNLLLARLLGKAGIWNRLWR